MSFLKIAHRGASGAYPENTLLAFSRALEMGAEGLEFDVHACASGEAVVIHDETLERTTNGHGRVDAHSLVQLKALDAGGGETIPALADVLGHFAALTRLFIEIKSEAAIRPVVALVADYAARGVPYAHMQLIGFHPQWLLAAKQMDPNLWIGATPDEEAPLPEGY